MKSVIKIWCFLMLVGSSAWVVSAEHTETEIRLSSNEYIFWDGQGPYFSLCDHQKSNCLRLKMPKGVTPIKRISFTNNLPDTRASWLVSSVNKNFICAVLPDSGEVKCVRVMSTPTASVKKITARKEFAEARTILDGEIAMARLHSTSTLGLLWYQFTSGLGLACIDCSKEQEIYDAAVAKCEGDEYHDSGDALIDNCAADTEFQGSGGGTYQGAGQSASVNGEVSGSSSPAGNCITVIGTSLDNNLKGCEKDAAANMDQTCR